MKNNRVQAAPVYPVRTVLGEGSFWDARRQQLLWVDILDHKIYSFDPRNGSNTGFDVGRDVSAVVTTESGLWAYADQNGIGFLDSETGEITQGPAPEENNQGIRFNEGKCDPRGTFWAGTMAYDYSQGSATLYEFGLKGTVIKRIPHVTISNGLAWNKDATKFYFIDSATYQVHQYQYDRNNGNILFERSVISIDERHGMPDGMTIDGEDHLWIALFNGGKVIRVNAETGAIVFEVDVPVPKVTSCAFGGRDLNELYITTASYLMDKKQLKKYPLSGSLFKAGVPFKGILSNEMKIQRPDI
jgi:sugar lactone lactonase YvrE